MSLLTCRLHQILAVEGTGDAGNFITETPLIPFTAINIQAGSALYVRLCEIELSNIPFRTVVVINLE